MARFTIVAVDESQRSADIISTDAGAVLIAVGQLNCQEADVLQDGRYSFSVRLDSSGMWIIFQRPPFPESDNISWHG